MRDTDTGWWEAYMDSRKFRLSEMMLRLLGLQDEWIGFDEYARLLSEDYREYAFIDVDFASGRFPAERTYPITVGGREQWITCKLLAEETAASGERVLVGSVQLLPSSPEANLPQSGTERVNDLMCRLNSISRTLLSLLHAEKTDETVNTILHEILTMFRGDRTYIIEFDWERRMHACTFEVTDEGVTPERDYVNGFSMDELKWWTRQVCAGRPVVLASLDELPEEAALERRMLEAQQIKSLLVMPLVSRDKVWGYAGIDIVDEKRNWTNVDCQWFSSLVNIISLCLELQRSEQEARDERTYFERLYRHMPMGYIQLRMLYGAEGRACDYTVLDSNYAADKIIGREREQYVGRRASELGFALEDYLPSMIRVLQTGEYLENDLLIGERTIHSILYTTRQDEIICLFSDTTEEQKAHEAIYRNEKLLRNIYDNIQVGVELYDKDGYLVDINNKDMEIFGVAAKEDALGINFFDNPNVPVEVREAVRSGRDQAFRLNYPFDKVRGYYPTGKTGYLEIYTTANMLYDMHGELVNFMLINIDNTEINRAHSRLAEFESSFSLVSRFGKVGYCRFDLLSREGYGIPQWYYNLGEKDETPLREVIGVYSHVDPADRASILECIRRVKAGEIDSFGLDLRVDPGDNEKWTRINVMRNPMNNDPSKIEMVCVNYDITELKQTEMNLLEAKNKAEVSDRLKSAFLANMSHEIRTPLNAIVGFSNLLSQTDDLAERAEYMRVVEENNELLLKLISDILDLSKIEAGTFEFNYGMVDVNQLCEEAVRSLSLKVQDRPVELRFGDRLPKCFIYSDKSRLMQLITNFINNAVKFTEEGHITLSYSVHDGHIRFSVEDTGAGIPAEQQPTIFDRFVKLNSFVQGTGLGLSICKSIVEQMGGTIGVESEQGHGSCFWFSLPMGERSAEGDGADAMQLSPAAAAAWSERRPRILVAEDADSNFLLVMLLLKKEFDVIRAVNGEEAVRLCAEVHPDAVLMDIQLPVMDGLQAARKIRETDPAVPIVAVTAYAYDRQKAIDAGCNDYLSKPLTGDRLKQALRGLL